MWWYPGGRLFKGESFFDCARRKCHEEAGLDIEPIALLGVYSTTFEKSAWECPTQTINIVVYAQITQPLAPLLDKNHSHYRWASLTEVPEDPYVYQVYCEARKLLNIYC